MTSKNGKLFVIKGISNITYEINLTNLYFSVYYTHLAALPNNIKCI